MTERQFLEDLLYKRDKEYQKRKTRRAIITILIYSVISFIFFSLNPNFNENFLFLFLAAIFSGFCSFIFNTYLFSYMFIKSSEENQEIASIERKLETLTDDSIN